MVFRREEMGSITGMSCVPGEVGWIGSVAPVFTFYFFSMDKFPNRFDTHFGHLGLSAV